MRVAQIHTVAEGNECPQCLGAWVAQTGDGDEVQCINCTLTGTLTELTDKAKVEWGK